MPGAPKPDPCAICTAESCRSALGAITSRAGNHRGACNLLRYGLARLEPFEPVCLGVDVTALRVVAARVLAALEELGPERVGEFDEQLLPRVAFVETGSA